MQGRLVTASSLCEYVEHCRHLALTLSTATERANEYGEDEPYLRLGVSEGLGRVEVLKPSDKVCKL